MSKKIRVVKHYSGVGAGVGADSQPVLSKSVCAAMLAGAMVLGGGVFVASPAYADGYVDGTGNNIYYGYKTDASYSEARFHIEVDYYDTLDHAQAGEEKGKDPLGKFVRVHYLSNCNKEGGTADDWRFRPMWWFGVPKGLQNVQNIVYTRVEKMTDVRGNHPFVPAGESQFTFTNTKGYGQVSQKKYNKPEEWKGISNFYLSDKNKINSEAWKKFVGVNGGQYDDAGNTKNQWGDYQGETAGLQGIFVDWESAGQRFYDMTYVGEMTDTAWKERDTNPLRFAAGVYRFAGNWHYAVGQKHNTPRIVDHLKLVYPEVTPVKDPSNVSTDEQKAIKEKIATANKDTKHYSELVDKVEVSNKGVATITFKDNTKRTIPAALLVVKNEEDKDKYKPTMPERTPVVNLNNLTPGEKTKVRQAIIDANGKGTPNEFLKHVKQTSNQYEFKVNDNGSVEVTYKDDSKFTIPASELVYQGATIADWAPYVVPDTITVDNLKQLKTDEINQIIKAFDDANTGITPYDESKAKKNNQAPVTVSDTGDVTITWEDGSTTTISAWQFLKEKDKQTPQPPAKEAEKTFIVEAPQNQSSVNFDPFNATQKDVSDNKTQLDAIVSQFMKKLKAKDAKNSDTAVTIKSLEFKIVDGKGVVVFHAEGYKDATYPMSVFLKQKPSEVLPQDGGPSSTTTRQGTKYNYRKFKIKGDTPTDAEKNAAAKQFVSDNYDGTVNNCSKGKCTLTQGLRPKTTTSGLSITSTDGISYVEASDSQIKVVNKKNVTVITISDPYEKNQGQTGGADTTLADLKKQAKDLLAQRKKDGLTDIDLAKSGIKNPDKLNDNSGDGSISGMTSEKDLRDLIRKLTDATKAEYVYYSDPIEVDSDPNASDFTPPDAQVQAAVKAFLKANYTDTGAATTIDKYTITGNSGNFNDITWTPKSGTKNLEIKSDTMPSGIDSFGINDDSKSVDFKNGDIILFTVPANKLYKKKDATPAPKPGEKSKLDKMKEKAKEAIERNPNLTPDQKKTYTKQVDDAKNENDIHTAVNNANEQAKKNKTSSDPKVTNQINDNKKGTTAHQQADDDKKKKDKKERDKKQEQQLQTDKTNASNDIDKLDNLTKDEKDNLKNEINGDNTPANPNGATTSDAVQKVLDKAKAINDAKGALQNDIRKGALPFLDHGTGAEGNTEASHADDAALNELLGGTPAKCEELKKLDDLLKKTNPAATADELNKAVTAAKQANARNEQAAKDAANKQLTEKKDALDNAYNALTEDQKKSAKDKYEAATKAIDDAKATVNNATKPSDIKNAVEGVKTSFDEANKEIKNAKGQRDTSGNTNDSADELAKEKEKQIERINNSGLSDEEKKKAIEDINAATKLGDPTGIADRALKAKKIEDAKKQIAALDHLNNAQKKAYEDIINSTDAHNIKDDDGKDTGKDDIDNALADAIATDTAMARLEKLKEIADKFANGDKYKALQDGNEQKKAFDDASNAAGAVLNKKDGDAKNADQVNELYNDLLKAMQAIDKGAKGAGVNTEALNKEIESDKKLKPNDQADPKTPGDSLYTTASKKKKEAFDKALSDAEAALNKAKDDNADQAKPGTTPRTPKQEAEAQKAVDDALKKLEEARKALDGVNTKPLEQQIAKDEDIKKSVRYTKASEDKQKAYDDALKAAQDLINNLTTPSADGTTPKYGETTLDSKENKQKALADALKKLQDAAEALNGRTPEPEPTPTPADVDKTDLAAEISKADTLERYISYLISSSDKQDAYNDALAEARRVYRDPNATQEQVNAAAAALRAAAAALSGYGSVDNDVNPLPIPSPIPSPVPGGAGFGVNDNAPTTVNKGELNIQIDSAEADSKPGNAGDGAGNGNANAGNAGNTNAGNAGNAGNANTNAANAANANNNAANGANSAAVNAAVENSPAVKQADAQVAKAQAALDSALAEAKKVAADPHATQAQVDAAARRLADARKALADAKANAANVRAAVRNRVIKNMRSRGGAGIATGADVATAGLMATMLAAIGGAFATRRMRTKHANRD
ncbi:GA module [Gardnerella vaginalis]|uniref:GA module n=1 Tax=Gardnerella vaginalis TaxID=2702 RepID=UPI0039EF0C96